MRFVEVLLLAGLAGSASAKPHTPFRQLFVFGDSYSDIGEGYLDGNGPTAVAYMAQDLGLKLLPSNGGASPKDSVDFAVSGAQTGWGDGRNIGDAMLGFGMENQVNEFAARLRDHRLQFKPESTLFFIAGGLNDQSIPTEKTVSNLKGEIRQLYKLGGRHFRLAVMPTAIPSFSAVGTRLNPSLAQIPDQLKAELPGAEIRLSHWGEFYDEVMKNPAKYGIEDTQHACAGRGIFKQDSTPCATPDAHYFYHEGHPSTAVHKIVGGKLAEELERANGAKSA